MNNFDITAIEDNIINILQGLGISKKIYPNRPKAAEAATDFVVVTVSSDVIDRAAFGECVVSIYLFAKDINNVKNGKKLSAMYRKFIEGFPASSDKYLYEIYPDIGRDLPDDYGFHRRLIRIKTTIKAY